MHIPSKQNVQNQKTLTKTVQLKTKGERTQKRPYGDIA